MWVGDDIQGYQLICNCFSDLGKRRRTVIVKPIATIHYRDDMDLNGILFGLSVWPGMALFDRPANPPFHDDLNRLLFITQGYIAEKIIGGTVGSDSICAKLYYRPDSPILMQLLYVTNPDIGKHLWYFINHDVPIIEDKTASSNFSAMPIHVDDIPKILSELNRRTLDA